MEMRTVAHSHAFEALHSGINPLMCFRLHCTKSAIKVLLATFFFPTTRFLFWCASLFRCENHWNVKHHRRASAKSECAVFSFECYGNVGRIYMRSHFHFYRTEISLWFIFIWLDLCIQISSSCFQIYIQRKLFIALFLFIALQCKCCSKPKSAA